MTWMAKRTTTMMSPLLRPLQCSEMSRIYMNDCVFVWWCKVEAGSCWSMKWTASLKEISHKISGFKGPVPLSAPLHKSKTHRLCEWCKSCSAPVMPFHLSKSDPVQNPSTMDRYALSQQCVWKRSCGGIVVEIVKRLSSHSKLHIFKFINRKKKLCVHFISYTQLTIHSRQTLKFILF